METLVKAKTNESVIPNVGDFFCLIEDADDGEDMIEVYVRASNEIKEKVFGQEASESLFAAISLWGFNVRLFDVVNGFLLLEQVNQATFKIK